MKILIIEDESLLRAEVAEWLTFEGYEVLTAENGAEGVELALRQLPDLIICDITMPQMDGYGVLLELRSNPVTARIPFIFTTARAAHEDIRKGMAAGADDYITKPFTHEELMQSVESRLQKKTLEDQERRHEVDQLQESLAQEHEQRLLKGKLVAMFSHDFRNPLSSIMASNSLLMNYVSRMDEEHRLSHHVRIDASIRQLTQMLDEMLMIMQMDTGNLNFKSAIVEIDQFFKTIVDEFQAIYGDSHHVVFEGYFAQSVIADPRLLRSIAVNLISNAIKYSHQGSEIRVSLASTGNQFSFTVQDQGIGIPDADQARLFAAFQRGSNVGEVQGTGLGLAIVKQAVDLHGGSIQFESHMNIGTNISVIIPIIRPTEDQLDARTR